MSRSTSSSYSPQNPFHAASPFSSVTMEHDYSRPISIAALAKKHGLSASGLTRLFDAVAKSNVDEFLFCREADFSTLPKRLYPQR